MSIRYLLVNLFVNPNKPVRLEKQVPKQDIFSKLLVFINFISVVIELILEFIERNFYFIVIALAFIGFVLGVFYLTGLSAVESGMMYNHLDKVI